MNDRRAFTLIELLVAIAIPVVALSSSALRHERGGASTVRGEAAQRLVG